MPLQSPQVGAEVDVEDALEGEALCGFKHLHGRGPHALAREVRARHQYGPGPGQIVRIDVLGGQAHVGAVFPVLDERKVVVAPDAQEHHRGESLGIGLHGADVHAFAGELPLEVTAVVFLPHAGDRAHPQAEPGRADGDVHGASAHGFGKGHGPLQRDAEFAAVEIHARPADTNQVKVLFRHIRTPYQTSIAPSGAEATRADPATGSAL